MNLHGALRTDKDRIVHRVLSMYGRDDGRDDCPIAEALIHGTSAWHRSVAASHAKWCDAAVDVSRCSLGAIGLCALVFTQLNG